MKKWIWKWLSTKFVVIKLVRGLAKIQIIGFLPQTLSRVFVFKPKIISGISQLIISFQIYKYFILKS